MLRGGIRTLRTFALTGLLAAVAAAPARGATIQTDTPIDQFGEGPQCSLREAIEAAETNAPFGGCASGCPDASGRDQIMLRTPLLPPDTDRGG